MWEYNVAMFTPADDTMGVNAELDKYGANGWELVAVQPAAHNVIIFFFKRPRQAEISSDVERHA